MKTCPRCKETFPLDHFGFRKKKGLPSLKPQVYCPECTKKYRREHYYSNPEPYRNRALKNNEVVRKISREFLAEYLRSHPCVDCGNNDIRVLEFDHVRGQKSLGVAKMLYHPRQKVLDEIAKCEVRCRNCHKIMTGIRAKYWWTKLAG